MYDKNAHSMLCASLAFPGMNFRGNDYGKTVHDDSIGHHIERYISKYC